MVDVGAYSYVLCGYRGVDKNVFIVLIMNHILLFLCNKKNNPHHDEYRTLYDGDFRAIC